MLRQFQLSGTIIAFDCQMSMTFSFPQFVYNPNVFALFALPSGNIRNTERLSFDKQQSFRIMVSAFDCGQKRTKEDVTVHIEVKPVCKPGWQGQRWSNKAKVYLQKEYFSTRSRNPGIGLLLYLHAHSVCSPEAGNSSPFFWTLPLLWRNSLSFWNEQHLRKSVDLTETFFFYYAKGFAFVSAHLPCCFTCQRWQHLRNQLRAGMREDDRQRCEDRMEKEIKEQAEWGGILREGKATFHWWKESRLFSQHLRTITKLSGDKWHQNFYNCCM